MKPEETISVPLLYGMDYCFEVYKCLLVFGEELKYKYSIIEQGEINWCV